MAKKTLSIILIIFLLQTNKINTVLACGWFEYEETYRISMFRAEVPWLDTYRPFYYTPQNMYSGIVLERNNDWLENCKNWNEIFSNKLVINDIYSILYQVNPEMFLLAYQDKTLLETFEENTFIETLQMHKNKDWLEYLVFAKKNEYNNQYFNDPWNFDNTKQTNIQDELINIAKKQLEELKDQRLKERYAYHLIRLYRQTGLNSKSIELYNKYFENAKASVLKYWAMLHKAEALSATGKDTEANYLYSIIFNNSAEKRVRAYKLFDKNKFNQSLSFAKNKEEIAGLYALLAIWNPGPALGQIKKVMENNPKHQALPLLIMREVNKLEDWIYTPKLTNHQPALYPMLDKYMNMTEYEKIKETNKIKDLEYLEEVLCYLDSLQNNIQPELKDYLTLARAHLNLMANHSSEALTLFAKIEKTANPSIQLQKNIELALYNSFEKKITNNGVKQELAQTLIELEKIARKNNDYMKQLHSLCEFLSRSFKDDGDVATASLLKLKAETYKLTYETISLEWYYGNQYHSYYWPLAYLDRFASPSDIDQLFLLLEKKNKTEFEKFITNQPVASKNALLDLKGTLALRKGDAIQALEAFILLPKNYWDSTYEFSNYLDKNPFLPPNNNEHNKKYNFNKAEAVSQVVNLLDQAEKNPAKAAENYLKVGHFFYNVSYWGNSWMMLCYSKTNAPLFEWSGFYDQDILFGNLLENAANFEDSYYKCSLARQYYLKAEKYSMNTEEKAMLSFMKYCCDLNDYRWKEMHKGWDEEKDEYIPKYLGDLYKNYRNTKTFAEVHCPMMDDFAEKIGAY
jgi:hypothetical protein